MAKVKFTKRSIVILVVVGALILGGGIGFLYWRVNQEDQVSPGDSSAGECDADRWETKCKHEEGGVCCETHEVHVWQEWETGDWGSGEETRCNWKEGDSRNSQSTGLCEDDPVENGVCDKGVDCSISGGWQSCTSASCNSDCGSVTSYYDVCRGKITGGNCQECGGTCSEQLADYREGKNCDVKCDCVESLKGSLSEADYRTLSGSCHYMQGVGSPPHPDCSNAQHDFVAAVNSTYVCHNMWEDGRTWWECNPPEVLDRSLSGRVYCQDPGEDPIPIPDAQIQVVRPTLGNSQVSTGAQGNYSADLMGENQNFEVRFVEVPEGSLPNGQPYSAMQGPTLNNDISQCTISGSNFTACNVAAAETHSNMDFRFTNCSPEPQNPDWSIEKNAVAICIDDNTEDARARVDYTITVRNISSVEGTLERVVDRPEDVKRAWLQDNTISPAGAIVEANGDYIASITWNLIGSDAEFGPTGSGTDVKTYGYSLIIPKTDFGSYYNVVTAYPVQGDNFSADEDIWATCKVPGAGLFDEVGGRIALGVILLVLGLGYMSFNNFDRIAIRFYSKGSYRFSEEYKDKRRMERVGKVRERFEKEIKRRVVED